MKRVLFQHRRYSVTQEMIDAKRPEWEAYNASHVGGYTGPCLLAQDACPITATLNAGCYGYHTYMAGHCHILWKNSKGEEISYYTPDVLTEKLREWDRYGTMDPFSFELDIPCVDD
jgi:hypothetical protein